MGERLGERCLEDEWFRSPIERYEIAWERICWASGNNGAVGK